jgi:hypothetical protein
MRLRVIAAVRSWLGRFDGSFHFIFQEHSFFTSPAGTTPSLRHISGLISDWFITVLFPFSGYTFTEASVARGIF